MKIIKYICFIMCCTVMYLKVEAQLFLTTGYQLGTSKYPTFGLLVDSYNKCNKSILKEPLKGFGNTSGYWLAMNFTGKKYSIYEFGYHRAMGHTFASFNNGDKRHFYLTNSYWDYSMGAYTNLGAVRLEYFLGGFRGNVNIDSYYEYSDGKKDYSIGKFLNGHYKNSAAGIMAGLKINIILSEGFSFFVRGDRLWTLLDESLTDNEATKYNDPDVTPHLPTDYEHYQEIYNANFHLPSEFCIKNDLKPYYFQFGIQFVLLPF